MMTNDEMIRRVAARSMQADDQQDQGRQSQQDQQSQQQQALPKSGPGKMMLQRAYKELGEAIESMDDAAFDRAIESLTKAKGTRPNAPV